MDDKDRLETIEEKLGLPLDVEIIISFDFSQEVEHRPSFCENVPKEKVKLEMYNHTIKVLEEQCGLQVHQYQGAINTEQYFLLVGASNQMLLNFCALNSIQIGGKIVHGQEDEGPTTGVKLKKAQRLHLIENIIQVNMNLKFLYLEEYQQFIDKYPYHDPVAFDKFKSKIFPKFASWEFIKTFFHLPNKYIFKINDYFGEEISFYFLFIRFYTWGLLLLLAIAIVVFGIVEKMDRYHISAAVFSIIVAILSSIFLEYWKRYSNKFSWDWNMDDYINTEKLLPSFKCRSKKVGYYYNGEFLTEDFIIDKKITNLKSLPQSITKYFTELPVLGKAEIRSQRVWLVVTIIVSSILLLVIPGFNISIFTLRVVMRQRIKESIIVSGIGSIISALSISLFNYLYERLAAFLTTKENHRIQTTFNSSYTSKLFLFQFVNSFTSLFYIAFVKNNINLWGRSSLSDSCTDSTDVPQGLWKGCIGDLEFQLFSILLINLLTGVVVSVVRPFIQSYAHRSVEEKKNEMREEQRKNRTISSDNFEKSLLPPSDQVLTMERVQPWENQFYLETYTTFDDYNEVILQYSFISLFIAASPIAILLSVGNNLIQMKSDLFKIMHVYRRPIYSGSNGIGHWYIFLEIIGFFAVVTNVLLIGFSFPTLLYFTDNPTSILWVVVVLEHIVIVLRFLIRYAIEDETPAVKKKRAGVEFVKFALFNNTNIGSPIGNVNGAGGDQSPIPRNRAFISSKSSSVFNINTIQ